MDSRHEGQQVGEATDVCDWPGEPRMPWWPAQILLPRRMDYLTLRGFGGPSQEGDDLPTLRLWKVRERWHASVKGTITQDPEQRAWRGVIDLRLIQRRHFSLSLAILSVAGGALPSVQLGACGSRGLVSIKRIS